MVRCPDLGVQPLDFTLVGFPCGPFASVAETVGTPLVDFHPSSGLSDSSPGPNSASSLSGIRLLGLPLLRSLAPPALQTHSVHLVTRCPCRKPRTTSNSCPVRRGIASPASFHPRRFTRPRWVAPLCALPTSPPAHTHGVLSPSRGSPVPSRAELSPARPAPPGVSRLTSRRQRGTRRSVVLRCASRGCLVESTVSASFWFPFRRGSAPPGLLLVDCLASPHPVARIRRAQQPRHASKLSKSSSSL